MVFKWYYWLKTLKTHTYKVHTHTHTHNSGIKYIINLIKKAIKSKWYRAWSYEDCQFCWKCHRRLQLGLWIPWTLFWLGSQLFLITEDAISEKDLVSQSYKKSSKSVNKPLKREADGRWRVGGTLTLFPTQTPTCSQITFLTITPLSGFCQRMVIRAFSGERLKRKQYIY